MEKYYSIGLDYGSLSVRTVIVDISNGAVVDSQVYEYPNGVITDKLPETNVKLGVNWALQDPNDYFAGFIKNIQILLQRNPQITPDAIIGIGIDFTSCTVLPVKADGTPLCFDQELRSNPHSWVKLWKHHAAEPEAVEITELAKKRNEPWIDKYGGKISSEWVFPKLLQILHEDPILYKKIDRFIEATDWIVWQLVGAEKRNMLTAGFKAMYDVETKKFPDKNFFKALHPDFENVIEEKIGTVFYPAGAKAGGLVKKIADLVGLNEGTPVCVGLVDAHVSIASCRAVEANNMLMIMGTSTCDILLDSKKALVPGICGVVKDAIIKDYYVYESGQNAVGDMFAWFVDGYLPATYYQEAKEKGIDLHSLLTSKAKKFKPGQIGMIGLDWINGNRSIIPNNDLSGLLVGYSLQSKPEEIYRCLIESTAFGKRRIIEQFENQGIQVKKLTACGGLPHKNELLNQIYADVIGKEIFIAEELQAPAVSSAIYGAVAAGKENHGFSSIKEASEKLGKIKSKSYFPNPENHQIYSQIYQEWKKVHDFFGIEHQELMAKLKKIKVKSYEESIL